MMKTFMGSIIFLIIIIVLGLYLAPLIKKEGFESKSSVFSTLRNTEGKYPISVNQGILDDYPLIGKNETSNDNYRDIWWHYPIFPVGSYKQVTNNLRYHYNPDQGNCVRADFCGAFYHNKKNVSNIINPLPPAEEGAGARVGYFRTKPNILFYSIPTNENILY